MDFKFLSCSPTIRYLGCLQYCNSPEHIFILKAFMTHRMIFLQVIFQNIWTNVNDMLKGFIYMIKLFPKRDMANYLLKNNGLLLS